LVADQENILEPLIGHESDSLAFALQQSVGRDRGTHTDPVDQITVDVAIAI
jgi:hypothetical protein